MEAKIFFFLSVALSVAFSYKDSDIFTEELFIKPLQTGKVYSHFQFTTNTQSKDDSHEHYYLFPKSLGEVLHKYRVHELHLSLTQSLWRYEKWGYPMEDAPPGAQLWVWFKERTSNIDESWFELINILSGMFCASLNFMDSKNTVIPKISFRPQGVTTYVFDKFASHNVRYAALSKEMVCTENLTPWKKLLPCGSRAGIGTLFNAMKLYDSSYHSLGLHYRTVCRDADCNDTNVELKQTLSVVFDPTITSSSNNQDWSLKKLFGRMVLTSCPVAATSKVYVDVSSNKTSNSPLTLKPTPTEIKEFKRGSGKLRYAVYSIPDFVAGDRTLNIDAKYAGPVVYGAITSPVIHAQRFQTGYGQDKGGITTLIYNHHPRRDITVSYLEIVPWFLKLYYHTLKIESFASGTPMNNIWSNGTTVRPAYRHYTPGKDRQKSYHLELLFTLQANSVTRLSIQFDRALLKWTEYPPDANHGFYVNSAVISTVVPTAKYYTAVQQNGSTIEDIFTDTSTSFFLRVYTESLLVSLPTPDFSMPYNVICLACTVVAIAFGSIHNLTTRQFKCIDPTKKKGILTKVKEKLFGKKKSGESDDSSSSKTDEQLDGGKEDSVVKDKNKSETGNKNKVDSSKSDTSEESQSEAQKAEGVGEKTKSNKKKKKQF